MKIFFGVLHFFFVQLLASKLTKRFPLKIDCVDQFHIASGSWLVDKELFVFLCLSENSSSLLQWFFNHPYFEKHSHQMELCTKSVNSFQYLNTTQNEQDIMLQADLWQYGRKVGSDSINYCSSFSLPYFITSNGLWYIHWSISNSNYGRGTNFCTRNGCWTDKRNVCKIFYISALFLNVIVCYDKRIISL